jgi:hypothetical protein
MSFATSMANLEKAMMRMHAALPSLALAGTPA